jgi:hypothetical protein
VEKKMQSLFFNEGGASPPDKRSGQDQSNQIGIGTFIEKTSISGKAFQVWHGVCTVSISQKFVDWRMI